MFSQYLVPPLNIRDKGFVLPVELFSAGLGRHIVTQRMPVGRRRLPRRAALYILDVGVSARYRERYAALVDMAPRVIGKTPLSVKVPSYVF